MYFFKTRFISDIDNVYKYRAKSDGYCQNFTNRTIDPSIVQSSDRVLSFIRERTHWTHYNYSTSASSQSNRIKMNIEFKIQCVHPLGKLPVSVLMGAMSFLNPSPPKKPCTVASFTIGHLNNLITCVRLFIIARITS